MVDEKLVIVGEISKHQGNKGEVYVVPLTDDPRRFDRLRRIFILARGAPPQQRVIEKVWYHQRGGVILKLADCNCISQAKTLIGAQLAIKREQVVELPQDSYFYFQLIGLKTFTCEGKYLGRLTEIFPTGSNDVYVIKNGGREYLLPALKQVVRQVDLERKKIIVQPPEGLN